MSTAIDMEISSVLPALDCSMTVFTNTHIRKLERCHQALARGGDLSSVLPGRSAEWVRRACMESSRTEALADEWLRMDPSDLLEISLDGLDDFSLLALSSILMNTSFKNDEMRRKINAMQDEITRRCNESEEGSALVDYDWFYEDVFAYSELGDDAALISGMERSLAHNLRHMKGSRAVSIMRNLAADLVELGKPDRGAAFFESLVAHSPTCFEIWEAMACSLARTGMPALAKQAAFRSAECTGDDPSLDSVAEDLIAMLIDRPGTGTELRARKEDWYDRLASLIASPPSRGDGRSLDEMARAAVAHIDEIATKRIPCGGPVEGRIPHTPEPELIESEMPSSVSEPTAAFGSVSFPSFPKSSKKSRRQADPARKKARKAKRKSKKRNR